MFSFVPSSHAAHAIMSRYVAAIFMKKKWESFGVDKYLSDW
jgi:hypothetical protein